MSVRRGRKKRPIGEVEEVEAEDWRRKAGFRRPQLQDHQTPFAVVAGVKTEGSKSVETAAPKEKTEKTEPVVEGDAARYCSIRGSGRPRTAIGFRPAYASRP